MEYLLGVVVVVAVLAFVVMPLLRGRPTPAAAPSAVDLATQRAEIYRELVELELDQRVGKMTEADFREQSEALLARAAVLIEREESELSAVEDAVEREIAGMRQALSRAASARAEEPSS